MDMELNKCKFQNSYCPYVFSYVMLLVHIGMPHRGNFIVYLQHYIISIN